ncbi:hypothetical protein Ahy_B02g057875 isoform C [Arachis hypogaea]|uniref:Uncharacterized protein n=1 Tax=Arachis hypogaea TaxID=3818 RepID=A0A445AD81_ARAHY|nr:hypothetical protein Ahy_B02g057875 isoform C [Arachis hypogaea]
MHDLMHDLGTSLAGNLYCKFSEELSEKEEMSILTRHLSYGDSIPEKICSSNKIESLRTLLYLEHGAYARKGLATLPGDILSKNKYLRVLSFGRLNIFPDSIDKLIQLRYLDLSWSDIVVLPESLCKLCNLQTLKLEYCFKLTMLANGMYKLVNLRHLDIRGTPLKEMPKGMGKLKQLHILSKFVIEKLENVVDANQARSARIIDKKHIDELLLKWSLSSGDDMVSNTHTDEQDILHGLQPHTGLKKFIVDIYKGKIFPDWIGHSLYQNMTSVSLQYCWNCCVLPSLGQLPSLKSLSIKRFDQLKSIVKEFYKNEGRQHSSPIAPFPSLERLVFDDMSCWEEWSLPDSEAFPQLKSLQITACRMLKGDMVNHVLMRIVSSSSDVSKVRQLNIQDGERWSKKMRLDGDRLSISGFESVVECAFKARIIHHLNSLQEIYISWSESVVSLGGNCLPKSLQKLTIFHCHRIELLQQQQKYDLVDLQIYESCDSLTSLSLDAFPTLMNLQIKESSNLESVSTSEPPHASLQRLTIFNCSQLVSFPQEGLATPNLTHLDVSKCSKLEALPPGINTLLPNLESLDIQGCPNICRWPEGGLPANLKELSVRECEEQVRGLSWLGNLDNLIHLTISGRGSGSIIKSYPEVGSLPHLPSLTTLEICWFKNLETLECNELLHLTSLQQLHISSCWKLENMAGEKLPPSLLLLRIQWCSLLEEHCKNKHQLIWPKISHIPTIKFVACVHIKMCWEPDTVFSDFGLMLLKSKDMMEKVRVVALMIDAFVVVDSDSNVTSSSSNPTEIIKLFSHHPSQIQFNIALLWLHSGNPFTHGFICCCCDLYHIMAEALVVGALLSGFANVVLDRLISSEFVNLVVSKKLDRKLVERLKTALLAAKALAGDAEQKQFGNELVREWLHSLRDALYTADDLLDRVLIKAEIRSKVRTRLPSLINLSDRKMATKIEEVVKRIEDLQKLKDTLGLKEIPTESLRTFLFINNAQFHVRMLRYCSRLRMLPNGMYNLVNLRHLDIWGTHLKEMPKGMSKLNQLHILSNYIVGKNEDSGIQELGGLPNLHGSFGIQKLENVIYVNQARSAKIRDKKHIDELWLEWSSGDDMVSDTQTERDILDNLQPHNGLKELTIWGYRGKTFPNWAGHCSYQNMTSVSLESCNNCYLLPSLGQLSSLQSLRIDDFGKLKSVGMEFYKNEGYQHSSPIALFPSLQLLEFDNMPCWEEWCLPDSEAFPQLKRLQINDCPMLKGGMLNSVLMRIVSSSLDVLKVSKLEIQEGHQGWGKEMTLDGDSLSFSECESVLEYAMVINHLTSLQEIHISGCLSAISFPGNCLPKSLQKLTILNCSNLEFPQQQQQKYDLVELRIEHSCDSLTSLLLDAFPNLKNLEIRGCSNLESVSMSGPPHAALQHLTISKCLKLVASPGEGLAAPNLTHLDVSWCSKLEALPLDMNSLLSSLQSLDIRACPNICRLPEGGLLPKLRSLTVGGCEQQLRSLSWMSNLDTLTHLTIDGSNCESIKSFQEVGSLPQLNTVSLSLSKSGNIGVQRASLPHFPPTITYFIL